MNKDDVSVIIMIVASIILAYYFTMTLILRKNSTHHRNKLYQALLMGAWMGLIMILLMFYSMDMSKHHLSKYIVAVVMLLIAIAVLSYAIRQQKTINQDQFMLGMIEHHQMAIDMSNLVGSKVTDLRLKKLVNDIITSQSGEIDEMYSILRSRGVYNEPRSLFV